MVERITITKWKCSRGHLHTQKAGALKCEIQRELKPSRSWEEWQMEVRKEQHTRAQKRFARMAKELEDKGAVLDAPESASIHNIGASSRAITAIDYIAEYMQQTISTKADLKQAISGMTESEMLRFPGAGRKTVAELVILSNASTGSFTFEF